MSRKSKIDPIVKVKIVEQYLDGEIGLGQASKNLGVAYQSIRKWISIYQCNGPTGLLNQPKNKSYSKALKISAVNDYLNGAGSLDDICLKYGIRSHSDPTFRSMAYHVIHGSDVTSNIIPYAE